jgi:hypothetical protein
VAYIIEDAITGCYVIVSSGVADDYLHVEETYEEIGKKWNFL